MRAWMHEWLETDSAQRLLDRAGVVLTLLIVAPFGPTMCGAAVGSVVGWALGDPWTGTWMAAALVYALAVCVSLWLYRLGRGR